MQPRRRPPHPPWERRIRTRRHPTGRARRRWPRAYDGGAPGGARTRLNPRYHRAYDAGRDAAARRRLSSLQRLRESPVRNGLIGLAIAGAAAPVAVTRYQDALRTDPAHERLLTRASERPASDAAVSQAWQRMAAVRAAENQRERAIQTNMERHEEYNVSRKLAEDIYDVAVENDIDPEIAFGLVRAESSFRNVATSPVGAVGLTQLMPSTAKWLEPGVTNSELRNPETNLRIGFRYLRQLIDKYEGDTKLALLAYNRGPGTVDRALDRGVDPDNGYADFVAGREGHGHTLYTR